MATKGELKYLNSDELADLFAAVRAQPKVKRRVRDVAIFTVGYHRGLRASEVGLLKMRDLRLKERRLKVERLKGGISGEYVLTRSEVQALRGWLRQRGAAPGPLFLSRCGRAICRRQLHNLIRDYGAIAGIEIERCHWHVLRHSCATSLLSDVEGVDIAEVQDHLGHADIRSTQVYAQITSRRRRQLGERLAREWKVR